MFLSIIIPTFNEAQTLRATLEALQPLRRNQVVDQEVGGHVNCPVEIILADGGSQDDTVSMAQGLVDKVVHASAGRSWQMNAGAKAANGEYLLFLHADTFLPEGFSLMLNGWRRQNVAWGFFPLRLSGQALALRVIGFFINWRSRLTGVSTGDQCQFVLRRLFQSVNGFPEIPLMEDVAISKLLRKKVRPKVESDPVITSSRRWETKGLINTVLLMWSLRAAYFCGISPRRLAAIYYPGRDYPGCDSKGVVK